jgi:hypothetical protein
MVIVLPVIVLEATSAAELPGVGGRRKASALGTERITACGTEPAILEHRPLQILPVWSRRQKTTAERAVDLTIQLQLSQRQMQTIFAAGEQVELLVRHDEAIGK